MNKDTILNVLSYVESTSDALAELLSYTALDATDDSKIKDYYARELNNKIQDVFTSQVKLMSDIYVCIDGNLSDKQAGNEEREEVTA
ncbi:hypothetical protein [Pseudolactococcus insecticola]|uniref:Uncharacterized protein n=1 Tax=Pseudolactococcus insecticola TaxID=2709158 RepID=A0A6A0B9P5_9LACT|nr:hypothetical protein [Lactococcus insecticola]GFH41435.1 hypothetical protein Hs20B_18330 [Lactococcus insecticola]